MDWYVLFSMVTGEMRPPHLIISPPNVPQEGIGITFLQWLPTCQPPPSYGALESGIQGHLLKVTAPQLGSSAKLSVRTNDNFFFLDKYK